MHFLPTTVFDRAKLLFFGGLLRYLNVSFVSTKVMFTGRVFVNSLSYSLLRFTISDGEEPIGAYV
jgi:hypothetical protein